MSGSVKERVLGTGDGVRVRCEFDDWEFSPRFTDGVCPLCGWRPEGIVEGPSLVERMDWFLVMLGKAAPRMTPEETATLEKYLRAQKK